MPNDLTLTTTDSIKWQFTTQNLQVKNTERDWFRSVPWESVLSMNQSFCEAQKTTHQPRDGVHTAARQVWEQASTRRLEMPEAIDVCRKCFDLAPFVFNNGNTFAAAARKLVEQWLQILPPVEAQIARTTIGHYVVGQVTRKELVQVLTHFEAKWRLNGAEQPLTPPFRDLRPQPVEARAS